MRARANTSSNDDLAASSRLESSSRSPNLQIRLQFTFCTSFSHQAPSSYQPSLSPTILQHAARNTIRFRGTSQIPLGAHKAPFQRRNPNRLPAGGRIDLPCLRHWHHRCSVFCVSTEVLPVPVQMKKATLLQHEHTSGTPVDVRDTMRYSRTKTVAVCPPTPTGTHTNRSQ
jgi:hypothetical protein